MECHEIEVCRTSYIVHNQRFASKAVDLVGVGGSLNQILLIFLPLPVSWQGLNATLPLSRNSCPLIPMFEGQTLSLASQVPRSWLWVACACSYHPLQSLRTAWQNNAGHRWQQMGQSVPSSGSVLNFTCHLFPSIGPTCCSLLVGLGFKDRCGYVSERGGSSMTELT